MMIEKKSGNGRRLRKYTARWKAAGPEPEYVAFLNDLYNEASRFEEFGLIETLPW